MGALAPGRVNRRRMKIFYNPYTRKNELKKKIIESKKDSVKHKDTFNMIPRNKIARGQEIIRGGIYNRMKRDLYFTIVRAKDMNYMKSTMHAYLCTGAQYISLVETSLNIRKSGNQQRAQKMFNEVLQEGMLSMNHSESIGESDFQWGGVGTVMCGRINQRWMTTEKDKHGQWIMQNIFGEQRNLCIYTLYRVNPGEDTKGGSISVWSQQRRSLTRNKWRD